MRRARGATADGHTVNARSFGGALAWVPVHGTYGGREIVAARLLRGRSRGDRGLT